MSAADRTTMAGSGCIAESKSKSSWSAGRSSWPIFPRRFRQLRTPQRLKGVRAWERREAHDAHTETCSPAPNEDNEPLLCDTHGGARVSPRELRTDFANVATSKLSDRASQSPWR